MFGSVASPQFIYTAIAVVVSLVIHEYAHARVADWLGDRTPRLSGRLSFNPLVHFEPLGLIMILFAPIGWAKPVSVQASSFRNPRLGLSLVALAGPASNLILACLCLVCLRYFPFAMSGGPIALLLTRGFAVNVNLCVFNLIPLPPLDGSRVVSAMLPYQAEMQYRKLELYGPFILLLLFIIPSVQTLIFSPLFYGAEKLVASWFGFYLP